MTQKNLNKDWYDVGKINPVVRNYYNSKRFSRIIFAIAGICLISLIPLAILRMTKALFISSLIAVLISCFSCFLNVKADDIYHTSASVQTLLYLQEQELKNKNNQVWFTTLVSTFTHKRIWIYSKRVNNEIHFLCREIIPEIENAIMTANYVLTYGPNVEKITQKCVGKSFVEFVNDFDEIPREILLMEYHTKSFNNCMFF